MSLTSLAQCKIVRTLQELDPYRAFVEAEHTHPAAAFANLAVDANRSVPRVAVLHREGQPLALVAGQLSNTEQEWRLGYLKLGSTRARVLRVVTGGFLGQVQDQDDAAVLCDGLINYLHEGEADAVQLVGVRAGSPLLRAVTERASWFLRDRSVRVVPHWWLSLPASYEEFYRSRSPNTKAAIRQSGNRIEKRFGKRVELRCYRAPEEVDVAMRDIEQIAAKTYHRALKVGFHATEELRREWQQEAAQGWLAAFVLYLDEQPSAFWTGAIYRRTFTSYTTGFDPELAYCHPGTLLLARMIEQFCAEGVTAVDFGSGEGEYKRRFGTHNVEEASPLLFAPTFRGARLALATNALALVEKASRTMLRDKHRHYLKSLWRRLLQKKTGSGGGSFDAQPPSRLS